MTSKKNKIINEKYLETLSYWLILIGSSFIGLAFLFPVVHGAEQKFDEKTSSLLNVVGLNTELYNTSQSKQQDHQRLGYVATETSSYFTSSAGSFRVTSSYVKDTLQMVYLSELQGEYSLKEEKSSTVDMAKSFLKSYQNYAGDSFYGEIASMLDDVKENTDLTKYGEDVKFEIKGSTENRVTYLWTYIDKNGVLAERKNVILIYDQGKFTGFFNNWPLYKIVDTPKISSDKATAIAVESSKNFSYTLSAENGTELTVSGFTISPESLGHAKLIYLNAKDDDYARGGDTFKLYPAWFIPLGFDKFYPGDVSGMTVILWADTGNVCSMNRVITDDQPIMPEDVTTKSEEVNLKTNSPYSTISSIIVLIVVAFGCVSVVTSKKRVLTNKKLFSSCGTMMLCTTILVGMLFPIVIVNAASLTGNSRIYSAPDSPTGYNHTAADLAEKLAMEEICSYIENASIDAGYITSNLCGPGTNVSSVLSQAYSDEQNYLNTMLWHAGHFSLINKAYQDNNGSAINAVDIYSQTGLGRHFFTFLWVCVKAHNHTDVTGTPVGWTHRDGSPGHDFMSEWGFNASDGSDQCYMSFFGYSPMLSNLYHEEGGWNSTFYTFSEDTNDMGPCKWFVNFFYYYALDQNHTVHAALDLASQAYFGVTLENTRLYDGYDCWWPGGNWTNPEWLSDPGFFPRDYQDHLDPDWPRNQMRVFGDSYIKLQPLITFSAGGLSPTFYINGQAQNVGSVRMRFGIYSIDVSDIPGYVFSHFTYRGSSFGRPANIQINSDGELVAHYIPQYSLSISAGAGGTTSPSPGVHYYSSGTPVQVTAYDTLEDYDFDHWSLDGYTYYNNPITVTMNNNHNLQAYFTYNPPPPPTYPLTVNAYANGIPIYVPFYLDGGYVGTTMSTYYVTAGPHSVGVPGSIPPYLVFDYWVGVSGGTISVYGSTTITAYYHIVGK